MLTHIVKTGIVAILCLSFLSSGCVSSSQSDILLEKSTIVGMDITDPTGKVRVRFGLIRNFYQKLPTSHTNIYSPIYSTSVDSSIGFTSQKVKENFSIGATNILK